MNKLVKSFGWAMNGLRVVWREEKNFRIEAGIATTVVIFGVRLNFLLAEWIVVAGCIGAVLSAEMLNTAVEDLCNKIEPHADPMIKKIKDIMAGFVLLVCGVSVAVGLAIFSRYF